MARSLNLLVPKRFMRRITFLIDPQAKVARRYTDLDTPPTPIRRQGPEHADARKPTH